MSLYNETVALSLATVLFSSNISMIVFASQNKDGLNKGYYAIPTDTCQETVAANASTVMLLDKPASEEPSASTDPKETDSESGETDMPKYDKPILPDIGSQPPTQATKHKAKPVVSKLEDEEINPKQEDNSKESI